MRNKETEKLFKLAYTDAMTGVYNRNAYEEKLEKLNKANARLDNIMVVIVDLDRLKCINDTYGHRTGDDAIKTVADCIVRTVGKKADIYRIGGDEFVCIAERDISSYIAELRDLISFIKDLKRFLFMRNLTIFIFFNRLLSIFGNEVNLMNIDAEECCGQSIQTNNKVFGVAISPAF